MSLADVGAEFQSVVMQCFSCCYSVSLPHAHGFQRLVQTPHNRVIASSGSVHPEFDILQGHWEQRCSISWVNTQEWKWHLNPLPLVMHMQEARRQIHSAPKQCVKLILELTARQCFLYYVTSSDASILLCWLLCLVFKSAKMSPKSTHNSELLEIL